jgi:tetratricopeptide (TPR) repeat protein
MNKFLILLGVGILILGAVVGFVLYTTEAQRNTLLRSENSKTIEEAQTEIKKIKADLKAERDKNLDEKKKLLDEATEASKEKDEAVKEKQDLEKRLVRERETSLAAGDDLTKLQAELPKIKKESREEIAHLQEAFKKKGQAYEARILSAEAQVEKTKKRLSTEAERYHYNLGVVYTQNKDYDNAVAEFKTALAYNPKNAQAYYNLGILFDDYFKDKENAKYYYRTFLDLQPTSDDAEAVKEWLANLDKAK